MLHALRFHLGQIQGEGGEVDELQLQIVSLKIDFFTPFTDFTGKKHCVITPRKRNTN